MKLIEYVKEDWLYRLPYRLHYNRYRGLSRLSYCALCIMAYLMKDFVLLGLSFPILIVIIVSDSIKGIRNRDEEDYDDDEMEDEYQENEEAEDPDVEEELPFCQLFNVGKDMCLMVDHIEMCPDETAFIRVVDDEGYTPLYKRKVRRNKHQDRFIVFNGTNYYLDDKKTQPVIKKK